MVLQNEEQIKTKAVKTDKLLIKQAISLMNYFFDSQLKEKIIKL